LDSAHIDDLDLESLEANLRTGALRVAARFLEDKLNNDQSDYAGKRLPCIFCGQDAHYVDQRSKTFTTTLGDITLVRSYYHCPTCGDGWCPKDQSLGFGDSSLSPGVTRMAGLVASAESFLEGSKLLSELAGIFVGAKRIERTAKKIGAAIAADEIAHVEEKPGPSDIMYAGVDGTGIPMRPDEVAGRPGKQANGSSKTREVKQCVVWTADNRDDEGNPVRDLGSVSYSAAIEGCAWSATCKEEDTPPFARRVEQELTKRGFFRARRQVFIGDGALWIWNLASLIAPEAIQVVDLYHAKEHLSQLASAIFGAGTDLARKWAGDRHHELESEGFDDLLQTIRCQMPSSGNIGATASRELDYFLNNRQRMRYAYFRSLGLCVGSGVVESGCKVAIAQRLKRSGMFWSLNGANAIIALRCSLFSNSFDDFWSRFRANKYTGAQKALPHISL
jgi:hypothetical protein